MNVTRTTDEDPVCHVPESPVYQVSSNQKDCFYPGLFAHIFLSEVYATVVAFYLPLIVIIILNTQIYIIARGIINREKKSPSVSRHFLVVNPSQIGAKTLNTCTVKLVQEPSEGARDQSTEDFTTITSPALSEYEKGESLNSLNF